MIIITEKYNLENKLFVVVECETKWPDAYPVLEFDKDRVSLSTHLMTVFDWICSQLNAGESVEDDYFQAFMAVTLAVRHGGVLLYIFGNVDVGVNVGGEIFHIIVPHALFLEKIDLSKEHEFQYPFDSTVGQRRTLLQFAIETKLFCVMTSLLDLEARRKYNTGYACAMLSKRVFFGLPKEIESSIKNFVVSERGQIQQRISQTMETRQLDRTRVGENPHQVQEPKDLVQWCRQVANEFCRPPVRQIYHDQETCRKNHARLWYFLEKYLQYRYKNCFADLEQNDIRWHSFEDLLVRAIKQNIFQLFESLSGDDKLALRVSLQCSPRMLLLAADQVTNVAEDVGDIEHFDLCTNTELGIGPHAGRREMALRILVAFCNTFFTVQLLHHAPVATRLPQILDALQKGPSHPTLQKGLSHVASKQRFHDLKQCYPMWLRFLGRHDHPLDTIIKKCMSDVEHGGEFQLRALLTKDNLQYVHNYAELILTAVDNGNADILALLILRRVHVPPHLLHRQSRVFAQPVCCKCPQCTFRSVAGETVPNTWQGTLKEVLSKALEMLVCAVGHEEAVYSILKDPAFKLQLVDAGSPNSLPPIRLD